MPKIADLLESEGAHVARTDLKGTDIELDVTDRASVERAVEHVVEALGEPTVLVNNAGVLGVAPSEVQEEERCSRLRLPTARAKQACSG